MKIFLVKLLQKTIGSWHWPFVDKKFNLNHYFEIEKELEKLPVPFAVAVVTTYGHGSNLLIRLANRLSKDPRKKKTRKTHALAIVCAEKNKARTVEAIGRGIQEFTLLSSIGARDEVKIRIPNYKVMNEQVCKFALEYIESVAEVDREQNIPYDVLHDLEDPTRYDCSELIYHAINHGYDWAGQRRLTKTVVRLGQKSWSPAELEFSELFVDLYDSKKGFVNN